MQNLSTQTLNEKSGRVLWLDNLRTFMIFLVVVSHAAGVYEASGTWAGFWIVDDPATNNFSGLLFLVLDIIMMPMVFLISGYLAPLSLDGKSTWKFIKSKFTRLVIPWLIAVLTLIPLYKVIFLASRGLPQDSWTTYFHFSNGIWGMNWLWFLPALFIINMIYLVVAKSGIRIPDVSLKTTLIVVFVTGVLYSILMDINGLRGWTKLPFIDFQNERALIYLLSFGLGVKFFRKDAFSSKPKLGVLFYATNVTNWIPVMLYIALLLYPWIKPGEYIVSELVHRCTLWFCFHLSMFSIGYPMIQTFRRYFNKQSRIGGILNRSTYSIYIIHVVVQGGIAWWMLQMDTPSILKHLILAVATYIVSTLAVSCYHLAIDKFRKQGS